MSREPTGPRGSPTWVPAKDAPREPQSPGAILPDRYAHPVALAAGAMGEVWRVHDRLLGCSCAMKVLRPHLAQHAKARARFVAEAKSQAQLQHPSVVPVHELGTLADGRPYFTMPVVDGRTFTSVVHAVHRASEGGPWRETADGWSFRGLVEVFQQVCETLAYAHERGVIHRDLKPDNVMVGAFGEVRVMDWGLAKALTADAAPAPGTPGTPVARADGFATVAGTVAGTPAYMAPEQARGDLEAIGPHSDVYALGSLLYHVLSGRRPYADLRGSDAVVKVRAGPPTPLAPPHPGLDPLDTLDPLLSESASHRLLPPELVAVCEAAMAREPASRIAGAALLADAVRDWLDGSRRDERATALVDAAIARRPQVAALRDEANRLAADARRHARDLPAWATADAWAPAWDLEDEAADHATRAELEAVRVDETLHAALRVSPALPVAHAELVASYVEAHRVAEADDDHAGAARAEHRIREHLRGLTGDDPRRFAALRYLEGNGTLDLHTVPSGAEVTVERFVERGRRLVPMPTGRVLTTPVSGQRLPMGSYRMRVRAPGRAEMRYPVEITRRGHWDGVAPDGSEPEPVPLLRADALGPEDVHIPAGWCRVGSRVHDQAIEMRRVWIPGFVMRRDPVTNGAYLAFLDDLVAQGREAEAMRHEPRERGGFEGDVGRPIFGRRDDGTYYLREDADGDPWRPRFPVVMIDHAAMEAYAAWAAERTRRPWRLPTEWEWEKAARGVDGRAYPWGRTMLRSWTCIRGSRPGRPGPVAVDDVAMDVSPHGVRGMAGNVIDWTASGFDGDGMPPDDAPDADARRVYKGGYWNASPTGAAAGWRASALPASRSYFLGFRLARSLVADDR